MINVKCKVLYSVFDANSIKSNTVIKWISKSSCNFDIHEVFKICFEVTDNTSVQWVQLIFTSYLFLGKKH